MTRIKINNPSGNKKVNWAKPFLLLLTLIISLCAGLTFLYKDSVEHIWLSLENTLETATLSLYETHIVPHFETHKMTILNREFTPLEDIQNQLKDEDLNLLTLSTQKINEKLESLPWVRKSIIQKKFPHELVIKLQERMPRAKWQSDNKLFIIDAEGNILQETNLTEWSNLIIFAGKDAPTHADFLLNDLSHFPELLNKVVSASWIGNRRWNIYLGNGIEIKLPEKDSGKHLALIEKLDQTKDLFNRNVETIDLRQPNKIILRVEKNTLFVPKSDKDKRI